jgi:translation initiation factor IF-2
VKVNIVQKGVGMMTETDINNAAAFGAMVIGFNSRPESALRSGGQTERASSGRRTASSMSCSMP